MHIVIYTYMYIRAYNYHTHACIMNIFFMNRYDVYGSSYYEQEQEYVKGSRSQYVHRQLYQFFASARYANITLSLS